MSSPTLPDGWTIEALLACVDREIKLRLRVYPDWVEIGKMSAAKANHELAAMSAVRAALLQWPPTVPAQADLFGEGKR